MRRGSAAVALIALGLLAPLVASADPPTPDTYTATGIPAAVKPLLPATYTIALANNGSSSASLATIALPSGFTLDPTVTAKTSPAGTCSAADWTVDTTKPPVAVVAPSDEANELCPGGVLTITFQAIAPATEGVYTWVTGLGPATFTHDSDPTVRVDGTPPPAPSIAGPPTPTNQTSATFVFSDSEANLTFFCQLDGGESAPCTSPKTYTGLSDDSHRFAVRAEDAAGNTGESSTSTYRWRVDTVAPDTAISSGPAFTSSSASATFIFTSTKGGTSFSCSLDVDRFAPCDSPQTYGGLANGAHTLRVRATDAAGNTDPSPASYTWTVDAHGPTRIDQTPPAEVGTVVKSVRYRLLKLRWKSPPDEDFDHVVVVVGKTPYSSPKTPVYQGAGTSYTDAKFRNGSYYRYAIISYDHAGNASRGVVVVVPAGALLIAPREGTRLGRPPLLDWASVPRATYYNVQLYFGSQKVLSAWPTRSKLRLKRTWSYQNGFQRLKKGKYHWYVWSGFGRRSKARYGQLLGQASFVFTG
ncbi:MAG: hypothetical protein M3R39_01855 [Actinomycetota bacterium]|nr:hypothetical protein [Actinomycetota bacterium]